MSKTKWILDASHSEVTFKIKHMMISNVSGSFSKFDVQAETEEEDFTNAKITFTADVNSINTNNEQRDEHLKSADFFDTQKFPQIKFVSTKFVGNGSDYKLFGDLTIKEVTKPLTFDVEFGGIAKDPWGNTKAGFTINGKINRKDFGLTWNAVTEAGGVLVAEELKIQIEIQLQK